MYWVKRLILLICYAVYIDGDTSLLKVETRTAMPKCPMAKQFPNPPTSEVQHSAAKAQHSNADRRIPEQSPMCARIRSACTTVVMTAMSARLSIETWIGANVKEICSIGRQADVWTLQRKQAHVARLDTCGQKAWGRHRQPLCHSSHIDGHPWWWSPPRGTTRSPHSSRRFGLLVFLLKMQVLSDYPYGGRNRHMMEHGWNHQL